MILGLAGYDVTEGRLGDVRAWVEQGTLPHTDMLVVEVGSTDETDRLISLAVDGESPVGVVTTALVPAWEGRESVRAVDPPLGRHTLVTAIESLRRQQPSHERAADPASPPASGASAVPAAPTPPENPRGSESPPRPESLLRSGSLIGLLEQLAEEMTVGEVATEVCALVTDSQRAEVAALLLPDNRRWRVSGGSGLRPLEHRVELDAGHWLVREMLASTRGAVVDRSDVARAHLHNVPVSSREQLAFVTHRALQAVLVVGRDAGAFDADDLTYLVQVLDEAEPPLRRALELRELARGLSQFRDET